MIALNILMIGLLFWIFYEDLKDREISLVVVLLLLALGGYLNWAHHSLWLFLTSILLNILIITMVISVIWLYAKFKLQKGLFDVFGMGDLLFFVFLAISFPLPAFTVILSGSLIFSLLLSIVLKKKLSKWVPLAGLQALFTALVIGVNLVLTNINLYAL